MPSRILREGILTSEPVNKLADKSELFYRRLMSVVDDYGRFYAHPSIVRANCYPLQLDRYSESDVKHLISDCKSNGLLLIYSDGKYLAVANFRQQTRSASKFPKPTVDELLNNGFTIDSFYTKSETYSDTDTKTDTKSRPDKDEIVNYCKSIGLPDSDGEALFDKWEGNGFKNNNKPIKDWKATIRTWKAYGYLPSQKNPRGAGKKNGADWPMRVEVEKYAKDKGDDKGYWVSWYGHWAKQDFRRNGRLIDWKVEFSDSFSKRR